MRATKPVKLSFNYDRLLTVDVDGYWFNNGRIAVLFDESQARRLRAMLNRRFGKAKVKK